LGKVENCQASVVVGYVSAKGYGLIDLRLYMPQKWLITNYSDLLERLRFLKDLEYRTKNDIASEMINRIYAEERFKCKYVGADSAFGSDSNF
jgi:SRSO17 transposase